MISDQEAIVKIKKGEIDAFSYIVKQYADNIYRYIRAKLFDKADVDDVVQNVFVNFYKAIHRFDESKPVLPYLYQIAKNELKMYYRSYKYMGWLDESLVEDQHLVDYYKENYDDLIDTLPENQKSVLRLLIDGYSYKEIADRLHKPINTIRTIIRRSRLQIKKTI